MTHYIKTEIDAKAVILVAIKDHPRGIKVKGLKKVTGLKRDFLYDRLHEFEGEGWIKSFRKPKIRGRFYKITEEGLREIAIQD